MPNSHALYITDTDKSDFKKILGGYRSSNPAQQRFDRLMEKLNNENILNETSPENLTLEQLTPKQLALLMLKKLIESYQVHQKTYLLFKGTYLRQRGTLTTLEVLEKFVDGQDDPNKLPSQELIQTAINNLELNKSPMKNNLIGGLRIIAGLVSLATVPIIFFGAGVLNVASGGVCFDFLTIPLYQIELSCQTLCQGMKQLTPPNFSTEAYHQKIDEQTTFMRKIQQKTNSMPSTDPEEESNREVSTGKRGM